MTVVSRILVVWLAVAAGAVRAAETRYLASDGDDAADGMSPATAWRTIEKLNAALPSGATARLRCGDTFYGSVALRGGKSAENPTVLTSYGKGAKPVVSATKNLKNDPALWEDCGFSYWRFDLSKAENVTGLASADGNPGFLLVDGDVKPWKRYCRHDAVSPWDFCCEGGWLYVNAPDNPARLAKDIRVALNVKCVVFQSHTVIDGIAVRATGGHGICGGWSQRGIVEDVKVVDCDMENIGGSELPRYSKTLRVRYGNGVEFGSNCRNATVERCTFKGVYDVAVTMQGFPTLTSWSDIHIRDCTMTDCTQAFEIWCKKAPAGMGFERCSFTGNRTLRVGGGWGALTRPNRFCATPLLMYSMETDTVDVAVTKNVFEDASLGLLYAGTAKIPSGYRVSGNTCKKVAKWKGDVR